MNLIASLVAAVVLTFGMGAPAQVPAPAADPAPLVELATPVVDPVMEADAYATYDYLGLHPNTDEPLMLEYVMTVDWDTEDLLRGEFVLASREYVGKFHVMRYTRIYSA